MPRLDAGEHVVWRAWKSPMRCFAGVCVAALAWLIFDTYSSVLGVLATVPVLYWFCVRDGVRFVLTNRRVAAIDGLGRSHSMPLTELRSFHYFEVSIQRSYGPVRTRSGRSYFNVLSFLDGAGAKVVFGYPGDSAKLDEIVQGHFGGYGRLEQLPPIDTRAADAYRRADVFFAGRCFIDGDEYGPLFLGEGTIVRYRSKMKRSDRVALERLVASHLTGEALDSAVLAFRREECPSLSWSWRDAAVRMTERGLMVPIDRSLCEVTLAPDDLARLRRSRFGQVAQSAHR